MGSAKARHSGAGNYDAVTTSCLLKSNDYGSGASLDEWCSAPRAAPSNITQSWQRDVLSSQSESIPVTTGHGGSAPARDRTERAGAASRPKRDDLVLADVSEQDAVLDRAIGSAFVARAARWFRSDRSCQNPPTPSTSHPPAGHAWPP